jgi:hypothetical protein
MALFTQNSNFNNNQSGENKPKTNFNIGSIRGSDGVVDVKAWKSPSNTLYAAISIRQQIGKDPNGKVMFEQGLSKDRPGVLIRPDQARAMYEYLNNQEPSRINLVDYAPSQDHKDQTISVIGSEQNVKMTIKDQKGTRTITLDATPICGTYVNGNWKNFMLQLWKEIETAVFMKVSDELTGNNNAEESPF